MTSKEFESYLKELEFEYMGVAMTAFDLGIDAMRQAILPLAKFCKRISSIQTGCAPSVGYMEELILYARKAIEEYEKSVSANNK